MHFHWLKLTDQFVLNSCCRRVTERSPITFSLSTNVSLLVSVLFLPPTPPPPLDSGFGRKDVVDHLLQTGANVHARDDGGLIPLHNACSFGHSEVRHTVNTQP